MLDVSFWELLIIGAIALVVVGPERLPRLMRTMGLWAGRARASFQSIRDEVEREVNVDSVRETRRAIDREASEARRSVTDAVGQVEKPADATDKAEASTPGDDGDKPR
ncbi:Sec-independent protein translocase protein TatB [Spiribacter vilamensis]|uniref:Sec-independent protein translocase protein TatB n=1 Tax=Spiribacter vilamensis TaxID=531306 RepID=A0A4Q8D2D0_9GAMM|nr:Sec-independent protein translocase protein TatB [Spiribacter vilamensis]RZU99457.1 sec-independent protein translocase protein TatB [Spiribacter vilamensis]TVO61571.1 twin-arginine translocase subunit TatB [Spiribacter vilamensis]